MYCGQCGTQNMEEAGHCETCGAPLLITAGARSCPTCGSTLSDHDRFCPTCGSSVEQVDVSDSYDASDDFGELEIEDIEISDLPDWLREMAPVPESPAEPGARGTSSSADRAGLTSADELPDWLREGGQGDSSRSESDTSHGPAEASGVNHQPAEQFSLVSDEDLPEWLKALGDEEPEEPSRPESSVEQQAQQTTAVATLFDVPPINRAWLPRGRDVDESQVSLAQQEFSPLEIVSGSVASAEAARTQVWDADSQQTEPFGLAVQEQEAEPGEGVFSGRGRQIAGIVVLAFLVIVTIILAFMLLQGMT